jgi:hypothetical protein
MRRRRGPRSHCYCTQCYVWMKTYGSPHRRSYPMNNQQTLPAPQEPRQTRDRTRHARRYSDQRRKRAVHTLFRRLRKTYYRTTCTVRIQHENYAVDLVVIASPAWCWINDSGAWQSISSLTSLYPHSPFPSLRAERSEARQSMLTVPSLRDHSPA